MARAKVSLEFSPGENIKEAFKEAIRIAKTLNCCIKFNFNGVICIARPEGLVDESVETYHKDLIFDQQLRHLI